MGASRFVGRVGGLAVALGVGAIWFSGGASADTGTDSAAPSGGRTQAVHSDGAPSPARAGRPARTASAAAASANKAAVQRSSRSAIAPDISAVPDVTAAPAATAVTATDPVAPAESAAPVELVAATRRQPTAAAVASQNPQAAQVAGPTASATSSGSLTVDPTVTWGGTFNGVAYDGVLVGSVGATSSQPLTYTLLSEPSLGGKIASTNSKAPSFTIFSPQGEFFYLPYATSLTDGTAEKFKVLVAEQTGFNTFIEGIPLVGLIATPVINLLHQLPIISELLAPLIGSAAVVTYDVSANSLAAGRPTAFTVKVPSFDGLELSVNYFPATNVAEGTAVDGVAPTILSGPGLGAPGSTDPTNPYGQLNLLPHTLNPTPSPDQFGSLTPGIPVLRDGEWTSPDGGPSYTASTGFNVVTWDPRGEFASRDRSLPGLQIDAPLFEARDVSAIISWLTTAANPAQAQIKTAAGDPLLGMVGGSYGGGIQWTTAGTDPRVDAIVPEISWNSLISSLYPNENQFKTGFGTVLLLALITTGAQINPQIYAGVGTGILTGWLSDRSVATLSSAGPTTLVGNITAPTMVFQGMQDVLFELNESVSNAQSLLLSGNLDPSEIKMAWFCGGHGTCNDPLNPSQDDRGLVDNLRWLDEFVAGNTGATTDIPTFQWYDQLGAYYTSTKLPSDADFNLPTPYTASGKGGFLGIVPIIGGSGPGGVQGVSPVLTIGNASKAWNAINTTVSPTAGDQIVGAPQLSFTYSGLGTARTVYAQLVDNATGEVLGNLVTPIPVVMDGKQRTVDIALANIGYTAQSAGLTLQITSSASNFENFLSFGAITISDIQLDLPIYDTNNNPTLVHGIVVD